MNNKVLIKTQLRPEIRSRSIFIMWCSIEVDRLIYFFCILFVASVVSTYSILEQIKFPFIYCEILFNSSIISCFPLFICRTVCFAKTNIPTELTPIRQCWHEADGYSSYVERCYHGLTVKICYLNRAVGWRTVACHFAVRTRGIRRWDKNWGCQIV